MVLIIDHQTFIKFYLLNKNKPTEPYITEYIKHTGLLRLIVQAHVEQN